jgi:HAD superfamily hydrolase (TIGR01458 family)
MSWVRGVAGALIDLDGTLVEAGRGPFDGAADFLQRIRQQGLPYRICSNTSRRSRADVAAAMAAAGLRVRPGDVVLPASLARRTIAESGRVRVMLLVPDGCRLDFVGLDPVDAGGDWVVLGDLGRELTVDRLDAAFRALRDGASLLALHRNPFWNAGPGRGWVLDAGAYAAALELASGKTATVVGKPARAFYELALAELGVEAGRTLMIGDNVANDLVGAAEAGCKTCLVRGTAFREDALAAAPVRPDLLVESVAALDPRA